MKYGNNEKFKLEGKNSGGIKNAWILIAIALIAMVAVGCVSKPDDTTENKTLATPVINNEILIQEKIKNKLIGMEITYSGKWGQLEKFNVTENDIKMINETLLDSKRVWKVRIGVGISWDYYFDENGDNIVKSVQLFII